MGSTQGALNIKADGSALEAMSKMSKRFACFCFFSAFWNVDLSIAISDVQLISQTNFAIALIYYKVLFSVTKYFLRVQFLR
jgi:hypothetical protein